MAAHDEGREDTVRTCVGCRQRDAAEALLRFAIREEEPRLVPDPRKRLPGRGVSVHPTRACIRRAVEKGGFARALRGPVRLDTTMVCALAAAQYERRVEGLLLAARRSGAMVIGTEAVRRALAERELGLLMVANDAAGRREELVERATQVGCSVVVFGTKSVLGHLLGRDEVGALAILDAGIADQVAATAARATELSEAE